MAQIAVLAVMAVSQIYKGTKEQEAAYNQAENVRDARNRGMAATTAEIGQLQDDKELMYSRALAVSASSGAGVDDPGLVKLFGDLNAEGEFRVMSKLYTGSSQAEGLRKESESLMKQGDDALTAGYVNAATTVLSAYAGGNLSFGKFSQKSQMAAGTAAAKEAAKTAASSSAMNPRYIGIT